MARPLRIEYKGATYHVISRGNGGGKIFKNNQDRNVFLKKLFLLATKYVVSISCYCLMDNHFHLLLQTNGAPLSKYMQKLLSEYSIYFNRKYKRRGVVFQSRYKGILVDKENYFLEVSRYIHLNPVKAGLVNDPLLYKWSSLKDYRNKTSRVSKQIIRSYFRNTINYIKFVREKVVNISLEEKIVGGVILGSDSFVEKIKNRFCRDQDNEEISKLKELKTVNISKILKYLNGESRDIQILLLWEVGNTPQKQLAKMYNLTPSGISHCIKRSKSKLKKSKPMRMKVSKLCENLSRFKT